MSGRSYNFLLGAASRLISCLTCDACLIDLDRGRYSSQAIGGRSGRMRDAVDTYGATRSVRRTAFAGLDFSTVPELLVLSA
jgi:hypothetical protein